MHALIIEQDACVVFSIEDALRASGFTSFDVAITCDDARRLARRRCPDLITSEVRLGGASGVDAVRSICSDRSTAVVFVTATGWEVRAQEPGLTVVQKPFAAADLQDAVAKAKARPPAFSNRGRQGPPPRAGH